MADGSTAARGQYRDHMQHCEDRPVDEKSVFNIARVRVHSRSFSGLNPMGWKTARIFGLQFIANAVSFFYYFFCKREKQISLVYGALRGAQNLQ
jgi:hypothetical protein